MIMKQFPKIKCINSLCIGFQVAQYIERNLIKKINSSLRQISIFHTVTIRSVAWEQHILRSISNVFMCCFTCDCITKCSFKTESRPYLVDGQGWYNSWWGLTSLWGISIWISSRKEAGRWGISEWSDLCLGSIQDRLSKFNTFHYTISVIGISILLRQSNIHVETVPHAAPNLILTFQFKHDLMSWSITYTCAYQQHIHYIDCIVTTSCTLRLVPRMV